MKKLILSTLAILLCLSAFVLIACNGDNSTTTGDITTTDDITTTIPPTDGKFSSKTDIKTDWSGKTLNIACSTWHAEPSAPWSVIELCVDYGKESGFGTKIDAAVLERQEFIKETYGVDLNWINATRFTMHNALNEAIASGNINYDLALPRAIRVQSIVANGSVYDLKDRQYIDFDNSYYNKDSVETYTAKGHTFFVDGDFSTLGKENAYVLFFNKELLGGEQATKDLYQTVRDGKWTFDNLVALASAAYKDDGDGIRESEDRYGLYISLDTFLYSFGAKRVTVDKATGEWKSGLKDSRINEIVEAATLADKAKWNRGAWAGYLGENTHKKLLARGELLFSCATIDEFSADNNENIGVVPLPMLNENQGGYCAPHFNGMITLMCIPKNTQDRAMSEYFLDVLSWTGKEYTMKAYLEQKADIFDTDVEIEMLTDYVFPNIVYDAGAAVDWGSVLGGVRIYEGIEVFEMGYNNAEPGALETLAKWNTAWGAYTED